MEFLWIYYIRTVACNINGSHFIDFSLVVVLQQSYIFLSYTYFDFMLQYFSASVVSAAQRNVNVDGYW
jgi:hypothetical protein